MSENIKTVESIAPAECEFIGFHNPVQQAFFSDSSRLIPHEADPKPNELDNTSPLPVRFRWKAPGWAVLRISQQADLTDCMEYSGINDYRIYNLLPGKRYYFQLQYGEALSEIRSFYVALELPRVIYLPDMTNIRDCGGRQLANGKHYKMNMLFRGAQFEPWTVLPYGCGINAEAEELFKSLKIKTELDLRHDGVDFFRLTQCFTVRYLLLHLPLGRNMVYLLRKLWEICSNFMLNAAKRWFYSIPIPTLPKACSKKSTVP